MCEGNWGSETSAVHAAIPHAWWSCHDPVPLRRAAVVRPGPGSGAAFYTVQLGFSAAFVYGEPPFYTQVVREAPVSISATKTNQSSSLRVGAGVLITATIALDDADALYAEYTAAGVPFAQALREEPWGARTFLVRDPDGNLLLFAGAGRS